MPKAGEILTQPKEDFPNVGVGFVLQPGQVVIQAWSNPKLRVHMTLTGQIPVPVHDPGWTVIPRARRKGVTDWEGRDPIRLQFSAMIDGLHPPQPGKVERSCRTLEKLSGHWPYRPPQLLLQSAGLIPHDYQHAPHMKWVIEQITWGDAIRGREGRRLRQFVELGLMEHVEDELVGLPAVQKTKQEQSPGWVDVKQGDTLLKIAARYGLIRAEIREAKELNGIRDASAVITKARIKLPPRAGSFGG